MKTDPKPRLGWGICGSFCTLSLAFEQAELLVRDYDLIPIINPSVTETDTRFGTADAMLLRIASICGRTPITTVAGAEPLGPCEPLDAMMIAPCTGNTLSRLALGITDTPVTMAAKAHLRADRPLLIALASNDALGASFPNLAALAQRRSVFFVPLSQDDPVSKPHSLVCRYHLLPRALEHAIVGKQIQPLFVGERFMD